MEQLLTILPNLSIGVVSVLSLVYVVLKFLEALREERNALRDVEADVRKNLTDILIKATIALEANSKILGRVMREFKAEE